MQTEFQAVALAARSWIWSSLFLCSSVLTQRARKQWPNRAECRKVANLGDFFRSGLRVPPPPGPSETRAELRSLADLISRNDAQIQQQIAFWDAGAPAYRWIDLLNARILAGDTDGNQRAGVYTYVALAMYDATIATWESKYFYNRRRPSEQRSQTAHCVTGPQQPVVSV